MRKAALIYNPVSGRNPHLHLHKVEAAAAVLRKAGIEANLVATRSADSGGAQAREAIAAEHDTIFACGGDGTLNDLLQGVVHDPENGSAAGASKVVVGIVPLGTGNVVASDQGISWDPATAIRQQLEFQPRRIAAGKLEYRARGTGEKKVRYFTAMAGAGVDAEMAYRISAQGKSTYGLFAYYFEMIRLSFMHSYQPFEVEVLDADNGEKRTETAYQVAAVRISNFGGPLKRMRLGSALTRDDLLLVLFKTKNRLEHFYFMSGRAIGQEWEVPGVELIHTKEVSCRAPANAPADSRIYAQADGDFLGSLPARFTVVPNAFNLLMRADR
jgi:diacylglycerol kinase family enzyme